MIEDGVERTIDVLATALETAGVDGAELDAILLTGGSSRIPRIAELLSERFDRPIAIDADPKAIVALGAARAMADPRAGMSTALAVAAPAAALALAADEDVDGCRRRAFWARPAPPPPPLVAGGSSACPRRPRSPAERWCWRPASCWRAPPAWDPVPSPTRSLAEVAVGLAGRDAVRHALGERRSAGDGAVLRRRPRRPRRSSGRTTHLRRRRPGTRRRHRTPAPRACRARHRPPRRHRLLPAPRGGSTGGTTPAGSTNQTGDTDEPDAGGDHAAGPGARPRPPPAPEETTPPPAPDRDRHRRRHRRRPHRLPRPKRPRRRRHRKRPRLRPAPKRPTPPAPEETTASRRARPLPVAHRPGLILESATDHDDDSDRDRHRAARRWRCTSGSARRGP